MKIAFVYAGQGSQFVGMGADFYETYPVYKETMDTLDLIFPIKEVSFEGPIEALTQTRNTQPAMIGFAIGVTKILRNAGITPTLLAGLSLGEYAALYTAGVFTEQVVLETIAFRAEAMEDAAKGIDTAMVAILGLSMDEVVAICTSVTTGIVEITNSNCPGQIVIGGERAAVETASLAAIESGAKRCIPLQVSGPFHTSCMQPAYKVLLAKFAETTFGEMEIPVVFNVLGTTLTDVDSLPEVLAKQVSNTVLFEDCIRQMLAEGVDTIIEIGPGKVLAGFIKKSDRGIKTMSITTVEDLQDVLSFFTAKSNESVGVESNVK